MIQFGDLQIRPGDIVRADMSGVIVIPQERLEEILCKAEELVGKEEAIVAEMKRGEAPVAVDEKFNYDMRRCSAPDRKNAGRQKKIC